MVLYQHKLDVVRSHLNKVSNGDNGDVCKLRILVSPFEKNNASEDTFKVITHELKRLR